MAVTPGKPLENRLKRIFSPDQIAPPEDHVPARFAVFPTEVDQICELVSLARKEGFTLLPVGGGTQLYPLSEPLDVAVSLSRMGASLQHNPHDLTATASAGMLFTDFQEKLAQQGQMLPLDPPENARSTLGGVLSGNRPGPLRHRYGSIRDWVLGTTVVNGHGQASRSGGKVVKNVSGYDLNKLYVGCRGTLGILLEASFKLYPLPETQSSLGIRFNSVGDLLEAAASVRQSPVRVEALVVLKGNWIGETPDTWLLVIKLAGPTSILPEQATKLEYLLEKTGQPSSDIPQENGISSLDTLARVSLGIKGLRTLLTDNTRISHPRLWVKAYPGAGICYLGFPSEADNDTSQEEWIIEAVRDLGGFVEFERLPPGSPLERWPIRPSSLPWMKRIKKALDPEGVLAPGTFIGGI